MKRIRLILLSALALTLCAALTGCMNDQRQTTPQNTQPLSPTATASYMPATTAPAASANPTIVGDNDRNAGNTASSSDGALTPFDWANNASQIEKAIDRLSEISDSRVVVTNSTALVGVKFDSVYKGQLTERIRQMVAAEVMKADPSIQTVAVTSDTGDVEKVYQLSDQIRAGRTADELDSDINAIVRNATTLR